MLAELIPGATLGLLGVGEAVFVGVFVGVLVLVEVTV
jgi:hypothetical protein